MWLLLLGPALAVIVLSLTDWTFGAPTIAFVGLENYAEMIGDAVFWTSLLEHAGLRRLRRAGVGRAGPRRGAVDRGRHQPARLLSRRLFPARHLDAAGDGAGVPVRVPSDRRPRQPGAFGDRAADHRLAEEPEHRALCARRHRHLAEPRPEHGAVPCRAESRAARPLRGGRRRRRGRRLGALPPRHLADAGTGLRVRRDASPRSARSRSSTRSRC